MDTSVASKSLLPRFPSRSSKAGDKGFLSRDITIRDLILNKGDVHHLFPRNHLKCQGLERGRYNQIANYALAQQEINIAIGDKAPAVYFHELAAQCDGGKKKYGGITKLDEMNQNLAMNCIPEAMLNGGALDYDAFWNNAANSWRQRCKHTSICSNPWTTNLEIAGNFKTACF